MNKLAVRVRLRSYHDCENLAHLNNDFVGNVNIKGVNDPSTALGLASQLGGIPFEMTISSPDTFAVSDYTSSLVRERLMCI